jgi:hypothetical protein
MELNLLADILDRAHGMGLELDVPDLFVVAEAVLRVELDGDDPRSVSRWARDILEQEFDLKQLTKEGESVRAIAATTGLSKSSVQRMLKRAGLSARCL